MENDRRRKDSRLHTIRGKLWTMVMLLAAVNCVFGLGVFVLASLVMPESWVPPMLTIFVSAATTVAFAYWASSVVLRPLDKLILLAKSIERTPGMAVPDTTGSVETDDLLHTVSRASQQLTNYIALMDDVAAGKTQAALEPLEHSDRLSESFQKLVSRVTDSIDAKMKLDQLQAAVDDINRSLGRMRRGEPAEFVSDHDDTRSIAETLRHLHEWKHNACRALANCVGDLKTVVNDGRGRLSNVTEHNSLLERELQDVAAALPAAQSEADAAFMRLAHALEAVDGLVDDLTRLDPVEEDNAKANGSVRRQFDAGLHKLREIAEQSFSIKNSARAFHDLARRANLAALNTAARVMGEDSEALDEVTDELSQISEQAEASYLAVASLSDAVVRDVNEANASIQWVLTEHAKIAERTSAAVLALHGVRQTISPLRDLPASIDSARSELKGRADEAVRTIEGCIGRTTQTADEIRSCDASFKMLKEPFEVLRRLAADEPVFTPKAVIPPAAVNGNGTAEHTVVPGEM